jgi:hypothetical protein
MSKPVEDDCAVHHFASQKPPATADFLVHVPPTLHAVFHIPDNIEMGHNWLQRNTCPKVDKAKGTVGVYLSIITRARYFNS